MKNRCLFLCLIFFLLAIHLEPQSALADDPLLARMISPKYRNAIYPTMELPKDLIIRVKINLSSNDLTSATISAQLGRNNTPIKNWQFSQLSKEDVLVLPIDDVLFEYTRSGPYVKDDNPYEIQLELFTGTTLLDTETLELHNYPPPPPGVTEVRIDDQDNVLINGDPTLIFGAYIRNKTPETYDQLKAWGFNAAKTTEGNYDDLWFMGTVAKVHSTPEDLSWMRSRIQSYREDPQIIAWYIADEPNLSDNVDSDTLRLIYQMAKDEDPYHPAGWVSSLLSSPGDRIFGILDYEGTTDFIGIDAYPCYPDWTYLRNVTTNFELLRDLSLGAAKFEHIDIPTWGVPQMFEYSHWRWPNPQEEKNMVYQYIANGATALFPYAYTEENIPMWEYWAETLIPELKSIDAAVFAPMTSGTTAPFPRNHVTVQSSDADNLVWSYRQSDEAEYLFLINTTSKWNIPLDTRVPGPKDKIISIEVTFNEPGSGTVESLIREPNMPQTFNLSGNKLVVQLNGVNDQSTGVLVLKREKSPVQREDINRDGVVDARDLQLCVNVLIGAETDTILLERADVNDDDSINAADLEQVLEMILQ
jgi:hypothetical protein